MSDANYVGAVFDYNDDAVLVWERTSPDQRTFRRFPAPRYFYVPAEDGEYTSIYGEKLEKLEFDNIDEWNNAIRQYPAAHRHESDIQPLYKVLMNKYYKKPNPILNFAFVDIETDVKMSIGWSTIENPYAPINAVTVYQSWTGKYLTFLVPPKKYDIKNFNTEVQAMMKELKLDFAPDFVMCANETELLMKFIDSIQNADLLSGWNSEFFDIPYIMRRLERVSPKLAAKMSFIGARPPKVRLVKKFGEDQVTYKLSGRTHMDYLDLFKKFAQDVRYPTYSLGFVGEAEVGAPKIGFEGTFEEFYNGEFAKFACYNARDVDIIVKINAKRKLIQLVNTMAHESTVLFDSLLGTVRYVETALINRAHNVHNQIVRDKNGMSSDGAKVGGALVLDPVAGLHEWLGSVDINSLYPSVIRALNISPEMMIGQFISGNCSDEIKRCGSHFPPENNKLLPEWKQELIAHNIRRRKAKETDDEIDSTNTTDGEYDWAGIQALDDLEHTLLLTEVGQKMLNTDEDRLTFTGEEWLDVLFAQKWAVSAYGTVFDQSRGLGVIPAALEAWYAERKELQAHKATWQKKLEALKKAKAPKAEIEEAQTKVEDYELMQMSKKLTLNSTYGAMLSPHFGLGLKEMGASVTACGRSITKHMIQQIGEMILGTPVEVTWYWGETVIGGTAQADKRSFCAVPKTQSICDVTLLSDTDSCYFKTLQTTKEDAIARANEIAEFVNETFPEFMRRHFVCSSEKYDTLIKAGREIVGRRGLFLDAKKKYTIRVVDLDGFSVNKLKMMGSELKKVDTPKVIQDFLKEFMAIILDEDDEGKEKRLEKFVNSQRSKLVFKVENPIVLGAAKGINNLDAYYAEWQRTEKINAGKVRLPGHVRAAINYNEIASQIEGTKAKLLKSGDKGLIFYLKPNEYGLKSIAIPVDFDYFPKWFDENFQLDRRLTESKMIDSKIERAYDALGWEIPTPQRTLTNKILKF